MNENCKAKRYQERIRSDFERTYKSRLGAIRIPERLIAFDDGNVEKLQ